MEELRSSGRQRVVSVPSVVRSSDGKRPRSPFGLGRRVSPLEVVDFKCTAEPISGEILEERQRYEI